MKIDLRTEWENAAFSTRTSDEFDSKKTVSKARPHEKADFLINSTVQGIRITRIFE
jgi:hypothetical protein